ncbi:MAG: zinc ribbon domain-containing protein [Anaerolineae bacterium]|nr:zinc ribbon domain-containing protein [Anaerolineae bacterium]
MPLYTYRREDGTTFDLRQSFSDAPLKVDPETGQAVVRVVHAASIIFKGSGFYVNDNKGKTRSTLTSTPKSETSEKSETAATTTTSKETAKPSTTPSAAAAD